MRDCCHGRTFAQMFRSGGQIAAEHRLLSAQVKGCLDRFERAADDSDKKFGFRGKDFDLVKRRDMMEIMSTVRCARAATIGYAYNEAHCTGRAPCRRLPVFPVCSRSSSA